MEDQKALPYVSHRGSRKHANVRRFKKRIKRGILFIVVILAATYALNFFFQLPNYATSGVTGPKDSEQELLMKKLEEAGQKAGQIPAQPSRLPQTPPPPRR